MKLNITTKIVFIIFVVIFSFSGFLGWYFIRHERNALRVELDERIISLTNGLAYNSEYYVLTENKEELVRLANKLTEEKDIVYVSIRNQEGSLLAEALKGKAGKEPDGKFTRKVLNYQPEYKGDEELILASPQQLRKKMIGHVSIGFSLASFKKKTLEVKKTILWLLVLTIILPTIIIVSLMNRWIIAPIKKLVLATKKVAQGDLDVTVSLRTKDEMGILADSFNEMVHQLQKSYQALQETRNNLETRATELSKAYEKLKETQTQLIQADKMSAIGTLAGGIAHDFNNLLFVILGNASLLKSDLPASEKSQHNLLDNIAISATYGSELTKNLLAFARREKYTLDIMDVNQVIKEIVNLLSHTVEKMISIETHLAPALATVKANAAQIHQAILNICINAKEAMARKGKLTIETKNITLDESYKNTHIDARPGEFVMILISDTGIGMDEKTLHHLFEPFFTTKETGKGTGLGLSVSYGIVKSFKGFINVYSEKNKGTCFKIYIPASKEKLKPKPTVKKQGLSLEGTETIMLVDDNLKILSMGKAFLERYGYRVILAANGEKAAEIYQQKKDDIDLVILDFIMPGWSGQETLEELKKIDPEIKVLIASGYSLEAQEKDLLQKGAKGFLLKPFSMQVLLETVKEILTKT